MNVDELNSLLDKVDTVLKSKDEIRAALLVKELKEVLPIIENKDTLNYMNSYIAQLLVVMKKDEEALSYYESLIKQDKSYKFNYIGTLEKAFCFMRLGRKEEGTSILSDAFSLAKDHDDYEGAGNAARFISLYYYEQKDYDKALLYLNEVVYNAKKIYNKSMESESLYRIGCINLFQENYNIAINYFREAENLAVDCGNLFLIYQAAIKRCFVYLKLDKMEQVKTIIEDLTRFNEPKSFTRDEQCID